MKQINSPKFAKQHVCTSCDYTCSKLSDLHKHFSTRKHKSGANETIMKQQYSHSCETCNTIFYSRTTLWRHKKTCLEIINSDIENTLPPPKQPVTSIHSSSEDIQMTLILELVKQNQEFKDMLMQQSSQMMEQNKTMIEVAKNSQVNNTIHNNISNSNNNSNTCNKTCNTCNSNKT